jgi:hypothetical protein
LTYHVRMPRPARTVVLLGLAALPAVAAASAQGQQAPPAPQPPKTRCLYEAFYKLRCPDLKMKRPFGLQIQWAHGRRLLRAGNSIDNVGRGPAELRGIRTSRRTMHARQRIYKLGGGHVTFRTGARLRYTFGHAARYYWKFRRAARFELWRLTKRGKHRYLARHGAKISYCLRDLRRSHEYLARSPRHRVYPACSTNPFKRRVRLGTSVGWSDIYPPTYLKQYVDVTGLRGCFALVHIADPGNAIFESNEKNNASQVIVRLPFHPGRRHCPGHSTGEVNHESGPY